MENAPLVRKIEGKGSIWNHTFDTFKATVYVPCADEKLLSDSINYGFISPYLLVFAEKPLSDEQYIEFAENNEYAKVAKKYASSVVFIYPTSKNGWKDASSDLFSEIITNSRIHQYYSDGYITADNRFTKKIEGYFIRGAIFRTCLIGNGESANYIATKCLNHFEGNGLWGRSDLAPVTCVLSNLSVSPIIEADDIPVISYSNSDDVNKIFNQKCKYFMSKEKPDFVSDYDSFAKKFRRMIGNLDIDPDLEKQGLIKEPGVITVNTSKDNCGDDKGSKTHKIGYIAFYNDGIFENGPIPLVLGFHGGGDSCYFFSIMAGWQKICHRHNFLLVTIENHLNSTATEMIELVSELKKKYKIDETRIYATGFSMGGCKTWDLIQEYPNLIAAAAPMDATFDVGCNLYGNVVEGGINTKVPVPTFYAGGEITPLPELPFQAKKCYDRMKYILELNGAVKPYNITFEEQTNWENKIWGINGDITTTDYDESRGSTLTLQSFKNKNGQIYNIFGSISGQGHDCREHTCEHAWNFMSQFSRDKDGNIKIK